LNYEGAWIPFDGDRRRFRLEVQNHLRTVLEDPEGELVVDDQGPHWKGKQELKGLSYSNTEGWGALVYSRTHALGVDLERMDRPLHRNHRDVAKRFFHPDEFQMIQDASPFDSLTIFMDLWMKKEAASKLMRVGLAKMIALRLPTELEYRPLEKVRDGYRAVVAISAGTIVP
jgi:phosphopantetheinyl transferase (holo-ACP synthase)